MFCAKCFEETSYSCLHCSVPVCNVCSVAEKDEDLSGWTARKSVGYCQPCYQKKTWKMRMDQSRLQEQELQNNISRGTYSVDADLDGLEESSEEEQEHQVAEKKKRKKKAGRKALWSETLLDDLVDIITTDEQYKKKLIFTNTKSQKFFDVYNEILLKLQARAEGRESCPFSSKQLRTKFKKAVADCKKAALTIRTATGITRFQEEKQYGAWFMQLFVLVKTRDSCQPEQAIEPSADTSTSSGFSAESPHCEDAESSAIPTRNVMTRKRKHSKSNADIIALMTKISEEHPIEDYIQFAKEEAAKNREHELQLMSMLLNIPRAPAQPALQASDGRSSPRQHHDTPQRNSPYPQYPVARLASVDQHSNIDTSENGHQYYQY